MPDGVSIPGGPSFVGNPQPADVPCDPVGDGWRGPPGPAGPAGDELGAIISDTPPAGVPVGSLWWNSTDGQLYVLYDDGTSIQWVATEPVGGSGWRCQLQR